MSLSDIKEYLQRKGSIEILIEIGYRSATFDDIEDAVLVSSSTVSTRLREADELELAEVTYRPTDYGTQKRYELSKMGTRVLHWIKDIDLDKTVRELQRVQRERDNKAEQLLKYLGRDEKIIGQYTSFPERPPGERNYNENDGPEKDTPDPDELEKNREEHLHKKLHDSLIAPVEDDDQNETDTE